MNRNVFIDCGFHYGEGLMQFTSILGIDSTWDVYVFEANPQINIIDHISNFPYKINAFNQAVWVENKEITFNIQHSAGQGSCLMCLSSTHFYDEQATITAIDFSEFISSFNDCNIYCKMDIEGAEFVVLDKLIRDNTIFKINTIWVEWHDVDLAQITQQKKEALKAEILKQTTLYDWH